MNKRTLYKMMYNFRLFISSASSVIAKKTVMMDIYEKIILGGAVAVLIMVLCTPLFMISPNDLSEPTNQYIILFTRFSLMKSLLLIVLSLGGVIAWFLYNPFKIYVVEKLGFQGNNYLLTVLLLVISGSVLTGMGDVIGLLSSQTRVLQLTWFYIISLIIVTILIALALYRLLYKPHRHFKGHVVGYHGKKLDQEDTISDGSLFDTVRHDEEQ